jgi:hypothetical protein
MAFFSRKSHPPYYWKLHENWRTAIECVMLRFRSLLPALRVYFSNFGRAYGSFLLIQVLGKLGLLFFFLIALRLLATPHVLPLFFFAQAGLFLLLAARFWQHGMETALALENPIRLPEATVFPASEPAPPYIAAEVPTSGPEQQDDPSNAAALTPARSQPQSEHLQVTFVTGTGTQLLQLC